MRRLNFILMLMIVVMVMCSCSSADDNIKTENDGLKSKIEALESNLSEAKNQVENLTAEGKEIKKSLTQTKENLENALQAKQALEKELEKINVTLEKEKEDSDQIKREYEKLNKEYSAYKEKMQPYEELDVKEAEARKVEAERTIAEEKARKEKEAAEEKARKEKEAEDARKKKEAEEKKGYDTGIKYEQLARTPDNYIGKKVKFTGKVIQLMEGISSNILRVKVNNDSNCILYCTYNPSIVSVRVLENDSITLYGISKGIYSYTSVLGSTISIPSVSIDKIEIK